jgi:hypothetical protein
MENPANRTASAEASRIGDVAGSLVESFRALALAMRTPFLRSALAEGATAPINRMRAQSPSRVDSRRLVDDVLPQSAAF